jgi:hypothetical protein
MRIPIIVLACALCAAAQQTAPKAAPAQPPPGVDAALRARITQFYQAHVDGKFRQADEVVAEDSKDAFFEMQKTRYHSFEIVRINYAPDFKSADAVVACRSDMFFQGRSVDMKMPVSSHWKVVNGQWFWYVPPRTNERKTPFGTMHFDPEGENSASPIPAAPPDPRRLAASIISSVKVDKSELRLSSYEPSSGEVKIANGMLGPIDLTVNIDGPFPGLTYKLDKTHLNAGESATLTFTCNPKDRAPKPTLTARITVETTGRVYPVKLTFALPPEIEKQLPPALRPKPPAR